MMPFELYHRNVKETTREARGRRRGGRVKTV